MSSIGIELIKSFLWLCIIKRTIYALNNEYKNHSTRCVRTEHKKYDIKQERAVMTIWKHACR